MTTRSRLARVCVLAWLGGWTLVSCASAKSPVLHRPTRTGMATRAEMPPRGSGAPSRPFAAGATTGLTVQQPSALGVDPPSELLGPSGPVSVEAVASDGSWVLLCHPTETPSAARGESGEVTLWHRKLGSLAVQALLAASPDGRYLVLERGAEVILMDGFTGSVTRLDDDLDRNLTRAGNPAPGLVFHPESRYLAFLKRDHQGSKLVIHELSTGIRTTVDPTTPNVVGLWADHSGQGLNLLELSQGRNRGTSRDPDVRRERLRVHHCQASSLRYEAWPDEQENLAQAMVSWKGGPASPQPDRVALFGSQPVLRDPEFTLVRQEGARWIPLFAKSCKGTVLGVSPSRRKLVVGCAASSGLVTVHLVTARGAQGLGFEVPRTSAYDRRGIVGRFQVFYSGPRTWLVDLQRDRSLPLPDRSQVLAQDGPILLVRRGSELWRQDVDAGTEVRLVDSLTPGGRIVTSRRCAYSQPYLACAAESKAVAKLDAPVLAVLDRGCALTATRPGDAGRLVWGPLRWVCPFTSQGPQAPTE